MSRVYRFTLSFTAFLNNVEGTMPFLAELVLLAENKKAKNARSDCKRATLSVLVSRPYVQKANMQYSNAQTQRQR